MRSARSRPQTHGGGKAPRRAGFCPLPPALPGWSKTTEHLDIGPIRCASRALRRQQILEAQVRDAHAFDAAHHPLGPGVVEVHGPGARQDVNTRGVSDDGDGPMGHLHRIERAGDAEGQFAERRQQTAGVRHVTRDEDVHVSGGADRAVQVRRHAPGDEVSRAMPVEEPAEGEHPISGTRGSSGHASTARRQRTRRTSLRRDDTARG